MSGDDKKELEVRMVPEVEAQLAADPKMAAAVREFVAQLHQARDAVARGQYKTMDDAIEAITGSRPQKLDGETGEVIAGASLHTDMGLTFDDDDEDES